MSGWTILLKWTLEQAAKLIPARGQKQATDEPHDATKARQGAAAGAAANWASNKAGRK